MQAPPSPLVPFQVMASPAAPGLKNLVGVQEAIATGELCMRRRAPLWATADPTVLHWLRCGLENAAYAAHTENGGCSGEVECLGAQTLMDRSSVGPQSFNDAAIVAARPPD